MTKRSLGIVVASTLLVFACSDRLSPTEEGRQPVQGDMVRVTLNRLEPTAGIKHNVLATIFVREGLGRSLAVESVRVYNYSGTAHVEVAGFTPFRLAPHGWTTFDVTLSSKDDIPCADGLVVSVSTDNGERKGTGEQEFYCDYGPWLF